jgi:hypothetical protein
MLNIPLSLLIAHFIGDFLMQTEWLSDELRETSGYPGED